MFQSMTPQELTNRLYEHHGSDAKVAGVIGTAQSTVNRIRRGLVNPNWDTYQAMLREVEKIPSEAA